MKIYDYVNNEMIDINDCEIISINKEIFGETCLLVVKLRSGRELSRKITYEEARELGYSV